MDGTERDLLVRVQRAAARVKLFPLPEVALFPSHGLPLHVFEPRYRALAHDALSGDGVVAIPRIQSAEGATLGPVFGVGVVAEHQELADGKLNLIVRGVARARLVRELPLVHLYREAEVEILKEDESGVAHEDAASLSACLLELGRRLSQDTQQALGQLASLQREPGRLADLSAAALLSPAANQRVLAELNVKRRLAFVTEQVAELLLATNPTQGNLPN